MELFGALRGRLYDSNKNLVMSTLSTVGAVASAMGPAVEKSSKVFAVTQNHIFVCFFSFWYIYLYTIVF